MHLFEGVHADLTADVPHEREKSGQGSRGLTQVWHLREREAIRVPGQEAVAGGPLSDGLVQNGLIAKVLDVKLAVGLQPLYNGTHGPRVRLLVHCADADVDLWQGAVMVCQPWLLHAYNLDQLTDSMLIPMDIRLAIARAGSG